VRGGSRARRTSFARRLALAAEIAGALVLRGRCDPRESVPFNAFDGIVDDLSHVIEHSPDAPAMKDHARALSCLFPVMARLDGTARTAGAEPSTARGIGNPRRALCDLLATLSRRQPLILWIDEAHRSDRESSELLQDLLAPGGPPIMLLLSYRMAA
jgi:hypothetical protein